MTVRRLMLVRLAGVALLSATLLPAQIPGHAVRLNPTASLYGLLVARSGETIHVVGFPSGPTVVHYARSSDGGRTWPVRELPLGNLNAAPYALAVDGANVHVGCGSGAIYVVSSSDGGSTWRPPLLLNPAGPSAGWSSLRVAGLAVNAFWTENGRIKTSHSADGGISWIVPATPLDLGIPTASTVWDTNLRIFTEGSELHLFWERRTPARYVVHQRSSDLGATWRATANVIASANLVSAVAGQGTLLVQASTTLWRSQNHGSTWQPMSGHGLTNPFELAMDGANVLAVEIVGQTVRMSTSTDAGATWLPTPYQMSVPASASPPQAGVAGDAMFVHGGPWYPQVFQSDDSGVTWRPIIGTAGLGLWAGRDGCIVLAAAGSDEVWAWVLEGHTLLGQGSPGTGGTVPTFRGSGLAGLGRTFALDVAAARGGSLGAVFYSFSPMTGLPLGGGALLFLYQPIGSSWFITSGTPGAVGAGAVSVPVVLPANPAFAGLRLASQAFVLDPGVAIGFAATRAVESWIR